jgi:hypothetical protein
MSMKALIEEAEALEKKQSQAESQSSLVIDQLILALEKRKVDISIGNALESALDPLSLREEGEKLFSQAQSAIKTFHMGITKMGKAMENKINMEMDDPCKSLSIKLTSPTKEDAINLIICEHLCREGSGTIAETFAREVGIGEATLKAMRQPYFELHNILSSMSAMDLAPAAQWAQAHRPQLPRKNKSDSSSTSDFEFTLLQVQFVSLLKIQGREGALAFARANFEPFSQAGYPVHRLMGLLAIGATDQAQRRYPDLLSSNAMKVATDEFARLHCALLGKSQNSPLLVAVAAGSVALPPLLKLGKMMEHSSIQHGMSELPVELDLGTNEFIFHSIFSCPVTKETSTIGNPPCLLPCGHMLCLESVQRIVRPRARTFKCPYCPTESKIELLVKIIL